MISILAATADNAVWIYKIFGKLLDACVCVCSLMDLPETVWRANAEGSALFLSAASHWQLSRLLLPLIGWLVEGGCNEDSQYLSLL